MFDLENTVGGKGDDPSAGEDECEFDMLNESEQRKMGRKRYIYEKKFENIEECLEFIANERCWTAMKEVHQNFGIKTPFRCNKIKYRGAQCEAAIYIILTLLTTISRVDYIAV